MVGCIVCVMDGGELVSGPRFDLSLYSRTSHPWVGVVGVKLVTLEDVHRFLSTTTIFILFLTTVHDMIPSVPILLHPSSRLWRCGHRGRDDPHDSRPAVHRRSLCTTTPMTFVTQRNNRYRLDSSFVSILGSELHSRLLRPYFVCTGLSSRVTSLTIRRRVKPVSPTR